MLSVPGKCIVSLDPDLAPLLEWILVPLSRRLRESSPLGGCFLGDDSERLRWSWTDEELEELEPDPDELLLLLLEGLVDRLRERPLQSIFLEPNMSVIISLSFLTSSKALSMALLLIAASALVALTSSSI